MLLIEHSAGSVMGQAVEVSQPGGEGLRHKGSHLPVWIKSVLYVRSILFGDTRVPNYWV